MNAIDFSRFWDVCFGLVAARRIDVTAFTGFRCGPGLLSLHGFTRAKLAFVHRHICLERLIAPCPAQDVATPCYPHDLHIRCGMQA